MHKNFNSFSDKFISLPGRSLSYIIINITDGGYFDDAKYDEMLANKEIASNLKASKEQIIDDLNGVLSPHPAARHERTAVTFG